MTWMQPVFEMLSDREVCCNLLPHPPHSPDLVPPDFHLFGPMNNAIHAGKFKDDEIIEKLEMGHIQTPENFTSKE